VLWLRAGEGKEDGKREMVVVEMFVRMERVIGQKEPTKRRGT
jgi:hypothetical protein